MYNLEQTLGKSCSLETVLGQGEKGRARVERVREGGRKGDRERERARGGGEGEGDRQIDTERERERERERKRDRGG